MTDGTDSSVWAEVDVLRALLAPDPAVERDEHHALRYRKPTIYTLRMPGTYQERGDVEIRFVFDRADGRGRLHFHAVLSQDDLFRALIRAGVLMSEQR
jgi:hypothetical protein